MEALKYVGDQGDNPPKEVSKKNGKVFFFLHK